MTTSSISFAPVANPLKAIADERASVSELVYFSTNLFCYEVIYSSEVAGEFLTIVVYNSESETEDGYGITLEEYEYADRNIVRAYRADITNLRHSEPDHVSAATLCALQDMKTYTATTIDR